MNGKIMKISSNDLYGNVDSREVSVFACFLHKKYMNKYIIFTFKDEYNKKILYYGSVHLKENSLVIFSVRQEVVKFIDEFINSYLESRLDNNEYEILDISKLSKVELVSYNNRECDKLEELDKLSIARNINENEEIDENKKPVFLYILLVFLILFLGGITYLYFNQDKFLTEYKKLNCSINLYNNSLSMNYLSEREILFGNNDILKKIEVVDSYTFLDIDSYLDFKNNNREEEYFKVGGGYKYIDEELILRIIYEEETIVENYDEMLGYLEKEGYSCIEGSYYE